MNRTTLTAPPFRPGPPASHASGAPAPGPVDDARVPPDDRTPVYAGLVDDWAAAGREPPFPVSSFPACDTCRLRHPPAPAFDIGPPEQAHPQPPAPARHA